MLLITLMELLATGDQVQGIVLGPYVYISFNLNNPVR